MRQLHVSLFIDRLKFLENALARKEWLKGGAMGVLKTAIPRKKLAKTAIPHRKSMEYRNRIWKWQVIF